MKKKILSILLIVCMVLTLVPPAAFAEADGDVNYLYCDENGANWQNGTKKAGEYIEITADNIGSYGTLTAGWYVVNSHVTLSSLYVDGDVHLILADNCSLSLSSLLVYSGNSLTIYAQSTDEDTMGKLNAGVGHDAAIGGSGNKGCGTLTINGGKITATSLIGAGIGGGEHGGDGGTVTINGGIVNAASDSGAGIGGGNLGGDGGVVTINGGTVTAISTEGAGIGGGGNGYGNGADVTITGGTVTAITGNDEIAAIGWSLDNPGSVSPGTLIITGGNITPPEKYYSFPEIAGIKPDGDSNLVAFGNLTLPVDLTIPADKTLTIPSGASLTIPEGKTLTIAEGATLTNSGKIYVDGALSGTESGAGSVYYCLALTNCTATGNLGMETHDGKTYATAGTDVTLDATLTENQLVTSWQVPGVTGIPTTSRYVIPYMPAHQVTATANLVDALTINEQPTGGTITYGETANLSVAVSKHSSVTGDLTYQWYDGNGLISGATDSSYTTLANLSAGTHSYYCVITCGTYTVTSSTATVTVNPLAEATPAISIDFENEALTGFVSGRNYAIGDTAVTTVDGKLSVVDYIGSNISIVTKASDSNHADSTAQALTIPARPDAPAAPTVRSKTSGSVTLEEISDNTNDAAAKYSMDGGATWQDSPEFTGLSASTEYSFVARYGATESSFASPTSAELNVTTSAAPSSGSTSSGGGFSGTYNYPVRVDSTSINGAAATLDKNNAVAGDKVTITVTPDAGKAVDQVIVTDADGNVIDVTKTGNNKYTFTMPAGKVNIAVTTKTADYQNKIVLQIGNRNILDNNTTITNDVAPVIVDNRTMVPIRVITETLGGTAHWNADTQTVTLNIDGKTLTMTIGQTISGFDAAPIILNDRTYVPVRYVAERLGAMVEWVGESQQIVITK